LLQAGPASPEAQSCKLFLSDGIPFHPDFKAPYGFFRRLPIPKEHSRFISCAFATGMLCREKYNYSLTRFFHSAAAKNFGLKLLFGLNNFYLIIRVLKSDKC
jgi:hypothetical protein